MQTYSSLTFQTFANMKLCKSSTLTESQLFLFVITKSIYWNSIAFIFCWTILLLIKWHIHPDHTMLSCDHASVKVYWLCLSGQSGITLLSGFWNGLYNLCWQYYIPSADNIIFILETIKQPQSEHVIHYTATA